MGKFIKSVRGRQWLYGVAIAVIALSAFYGLITEESTVLWIAVVAALLGLPVAAGNVTNGGIEPPSDEDRPAIPGTTLDLGATESDPERYEQ